jgi:hypothetical protein
MAVEIGTASNYLDLLEKFRVFITGASMGSQAWTQLAYDTQPDNVGKDLYLRGPGLSGNDQIFVQLRTVFSSLNDRYNLQINGATGFNAGLVPKYQNQPGHDAGELNMLLWNQAIPYWFVANGRRFIIVAKVSTTYQSMYGGFILPYGLPSEYPYPLMIGAMSVGQRRWSATDNEYCGFTNPAKTLRLRTHDGFWLPFANVGNDGSSTPSPRYEQNVWPNRSFTNPRPSPDGVYTMNNFVLHSSEVNAGASRNVFGEMQGIARISGFNNASENTQVVDGVTWVVFQDGFRTGSGNYFALALE